MILIKWLFQNSSGSQCLAHVAECMSDASVWTHRALSGFRWTRREASLIWFCKSPKEAASFYPIQAQRLRFFDGILEAVSFFVRTSRRSRNRPALSEKWGMLEEIQHMLCTYSYSSLAVRGESQSWSPDLFSGLYRMLIGSMILPNQSASLRNKSGLGSETISPLLRHI